jgi:hypothetical protein
MIHALCVFLGASVIFSFQFCFVLFDSINGWTPTNSFWRSCLAFHLPRTLRFHSYRSTSVLFFCYCFLFSFFALICVQIF